MNDHSHQEVSEKLLPILNQLAAKSGANEIRLSQVKIVKLHGDASNRIYYRLTTPAGPFIVMQRSLDSLESPSEEITKEKNKIKEYAFLNIQRYLEKNSVRVPKLIGMTQNQELILLEDLGDGVFEKRLHEKPENLRPLYQDAITLLHSWQRLKPPGDHSCIAWERAFDTDLLNWEFEHFIEWGIERSQNIRLPKKDADELRRIFTDMSEELFALPKCLVHRDFQSRNLMVVKDGIVVLDFQDALVGAKCYDLVALLRDSYISLPEDDLVFLQKTYMKGAGVENGDEFLRGFDLQTVQRKLKDGGRFHYIHLFKKNPSFLPHVPNSFSFAARALGRIPEGKFVKPILAKYLKEMAT